MSPNIVANGNPDASMKPWTAVPQPEAGGQDPGQHAGRLGGAERVDDGGGRGVQRPAVAERQVQWLRVADDRLSARSEGIAR